ncbi:MAG: hypothetical protein ACYTBS_16860 [Planctomycetota bacterium]|jgi:hypothetical protein
MKTVNSEAFSLRDDNPSIKEPFGWFAAGDSFRRALMALSDGAFKLFAHLCLEADRRTGRYEAVQAELAGAIGKSRRVVGKYVEELERNGVCTVRRERNQYAKTCFDIREEYWPYHRTQGVEGARCRERNAYVDAVKSSFVSIGCTTGKFNSLDAQLAQELQQRRIPLQLVQDALLMGACRKYSSWFNGGSTQPIGSLRYFEPLIAEMKERPLPADYREYLRRKVVHSAKAWAQKSAKQPENGGVQLWPARRSVNSEALTRRFLRKGPSPALGSTKRTRNEANYVRSNR